MKIAIVSHTPIDQIETDGIKSVSVGGPTCYSGLTIITLSLTPQIVTKVGRDFPYEALLSNKGLVMPKNSVVDKPTTRFKIVISDEGRKLFLLARCANIEADDIDIDTDGCIVSPIINEVSTEVISQISKRTNFVFLDPQGFVRKVKEDGSCYLDTTRINFSKLKIDAIKVDLDEAFALTGVFGTEALFKLGVKTSIMTYYNKTLMLHNQHIYEIATEKVKTHDSTGAGDVFAGAFTAAFLKSKEEKWALCYGVAAAFTALKSNKTGIEKVPVQREMEELASTLENKVVVS